MKAVNGTWNDVTFAGSPERERLVELRRRMVRLFARFDMRYVDPWERKRR